MTRRVIVRRGTYQDSARLMRIARELTAVPGVESADVMMGTAANVALLADAGFPLADLVAATPLDMVVAIAAGESGAAAAEDRLAALLAASTSPPGSAGPFDSARGAQGGTHDEVGPGNLREAVEAHPAANLVS